MAESGLQRMTDEAPEELVDHSYVICTRRVRNGEFESEPGATRYLKVSKDRNPDPEDEIDVDQWFKEVRDRADGVADRRIEPGGDVVVFVHGYNNHQEIVMKRHRRLQADLWAEGFRGLVVSFDWPSASSTLNYIEDRSDAAQSAIELVAGCAAPFAARREAGCPTNVHLLGHSTGAYVIREAFYHAHKCGRLFRGRWQVSQIAFVGGDISSASLAGNDSVSKVMFGRSLRITNYSNRNDVVLKVSNAKRLGLRPRVGRVGIPDDAHPSVVDVDCSRYFLSLDPEREAFYGTFCHSWHIGNRLFARDLASVLDGGIDRHAIPTRSYDGTTLRLCDAQRSAHERHWLLEEPPKADSGP